MEDRLIDGTNDGRTDKTRRGGRAEREVMRNLSKVVLHTTRLTKKAALVFTHT